jgi:hypothetical protein
MRRIVSVLCILGLAVGLSGATSPAAAADLPAPVGTGPQVVVRNPSPGTLTQVRVGRHDSYDRVVFQLRGALPGWDVRYVSRVTADPSGLPVTVAGAAVLRVVLTGVNGHDTAGRVTATGTTQTPRLPALTAVKQAGDFEAVMTFAIGTSDRLDFRVFGLTNPTRVVLDVAHPVTQTFTTDSTQFWAPTGGGGDFTLGAIRTGAHPGFDRIVLDLPGARVRPNIGVAYGGGMDGLPATSLKARLWTFTGTGLPANPTVTYTGPTTIHVGLPNLPTITVRRMDDGFDVIAWTTAQHGYRAFLLHGDGMNRVIIDVAH